MAYNLIIVCYKVLGSGWPNLSANTLYLEELKVHEMPDI